MGWFWKKRRADETDERARGRWMTDLEIERRLRYLQQARGGRSAVRVEADRPDGMPPRAPHP